jgi:hypothetical protein
MRLVIEKPAEGLLASSIETSPKIAAGVLSSGVRPNGGLSASKRRRAL